MIHLSPSLDAFRAVWPDLLTDSNSLISQEYLDAIHLSENKLKGFLYGVVCSKEGQPICFYYFQYKQFKAAESLNYTMENTWRQKVLNATKRRVAGLIDARGLVCGNLMITGDEGKYWVGDPCDLELKWQLHEQVHNEAVSFSKALGHKLRFVLAKDFPHTAPSFTKIDWNAVQVQPNMVMPLREEWTDMSTYLGAMKSKYRKRINAALRKVKDFRFESVGVEEIETHIDWIHQLYLEIVDRAPFNMFILSKDYFIEIKRNLGDACDCTFVYDGDKLVAFQFNILNGESYEAHFLGYDHSYLKSHDLYLNLLLESVRKGIDKQVKTIVFSRTAMQIKSSIGAVPEDLYLYLNIRSSVLNKLVKLAFRYFNPPVVFDQRHPFK